MPTKRKSTSKGHMKDFCQTPDYAFSPLVPYIPREWVIWEPAAGEMYLTSAIRNYGYIPIATDILQDPVMDFLEWETLVPYDCIVTNPPFSLKYKFLERCYNLGKPFALLMPIDVIGSSKAQYMFKNLGIEILLLDKRVDFKMPFKGWEGGGAQFSVAWFTWGLHIGTTFTYCTLSKPKKEKPIRD